MSEMISIITPMYNAEEFILDMIKSVQAQTYQNWEMIVVDDCSQDGGPNIIKKISKTDERIKLISQEQHSGPSHVRNVAIELAKGRYLAFLDSDDLWHEQKLNKQLNFMKKNHYAFTYTGFDKINGEKLSGNIFYEANKLDFRNLLLQTKNGRYSGFGFLPLDLNLIIEIKLSPFFSLYWLTILKVLIIFPPKKFKRSIV